MSKGQDSNALPPEFDDIRSYFDQEVPEALGLLADRTDIITDLFSHLPAAPDTTRILRSLEQIKSVDEFQAWLRQSLSPIIDTTISNFSFSGLEHLSQDSAHIFVSNHHDIIMDPLVINLALLESGFGTAHCAIGDNLLFSESATILARLNKCFRVIRSLTSPKAMLQAMRVQSFYIKHLHFEAKENIWIAQKEGRSKDNVDTTNPALIKMLSLAKPKDMSANDYLSTLNIVPVSISYEWDPCDLDKARQLELEQASSSYAKGNRDDLSAIQLGLLGYKGAIHVAFGEIIRTPDHNLLNRYEVANQIDRFIHENYRCYASNIAALGEIPDTQVEKIDLPRIDESERIEAGKKLSERLKTAEPEIRNRVLKAYAQPLLALSSARQTPR